MDAIKSFASPKPSWWPCTVARSLSRSCRVNATRDPRSDEQQNPREPAPLSPTKGVFLVRHRQVIFVVQVSAGKLRGRSAFTLDLVECRKTRSKAETVADFIIVADHEAAMTGVRLHLVDSRDVGDNTEISVLVDAIEVKFQRVAASVFEFFMPR